MDMQYTDSTANVHPNLPPPLNLFSLSFLSRSHHPTEVEIACRSQRNGFDYDLETNILSLCSARFSQSAILSSIHFSPFYICFTDSKRQCLSFISLPHHPSILTSTQFPSTSLNRTQNGSDLEATSRSRRLAAVTESSTRVTKC